MKFKKIFPILFLAFVLILPVPSLSQTREAGKIYKVAILPFMIHSQENLDYLREGIYDILSSRVSVDGRIVVIDRSAIERALQEERPMRLDEATAAKIGTRVGADYIVLGSITKIGDYFSLDARLISVSEDKPPVGVFTQHKGIDDVMVKIGDFAQEIGYKILGRTPRMARPLEPKSPFIQPRRDMGRVAPEGSGFKKSQILNFEIKGLDIGDVDGDKKNELVVMDSSNIYIFKYDGDKLALFQKIEAGYEHNFLTLDVADVNRNGYAEIIVTSVVDDNLRSFILEFEEKKFKKIAEKANWYFRVLDHPRNGPILIGQQMGSEGIAVGSIYRFDWKKRSFEKGSKMPFPKDTNIFGIARGDIRGQGKDEIIYFDKFEHLNVAAEDGKTFWKSRERYGGTSNSYDTKRKREDPYRPQEAPPFRVYIPGRILIRDLDNDGIYEVFVNKNEFASGTLFDRIRVVEKGEFHDLIWEENRLTTNWKTTEIQGYIADFQVKDVDNDGEVELVAAVVAPEEGVSGALSTKTFSHVYFLKLF